MNTTTGWNARTRLMGELVKNIYSANRTFKVPSGVVTKEVETAKTETTEVKEVETTETETTKVEAMEGETNE